MGNQPSAPQPAAPQPAAPNTPPPLPPVCDAECQRQKKLSGLKAAFDEKTITKSTDPEGYEQSRIAYMTELNGQGWLAGEKQRIATEEISPVVNEYQQQFRSLQGEVKQQGVFVNLMNMLKADEQQDAQTLGGLTTKLQSEQTKAETLNRLNELNQATQEPVQITPTVLYAIIGLLGLFIVYSIYSRVSSTSNPVQVAGKRLLATLTR